MMLLLSAFVVLLLSLHASLFLLPCSAVSPVIVSGNRLVDSSTHRRFLVQGSGYDYDVSNDNVQQWRPAINALLTAAPHINTIRLLRRSVLTAATTHRPQLLLMAVADGVHRWLRSVDPSRAYDDFMLEMNRRGVYVIVPLTPSRGWCTLSQCASTHSSAAVFLPHPLTRSAPRCPADRDGSPPLGHATCYPSCLLNFGQHVVNLFSPHPNVLLFTVGNEIINSLPRWSAAPCVKAYARDIQRFQRQCSASDHSRVVPLLYAAADNAIAHTSPPRRTTRLKMDYLTCPVAGDEDGERAIDVMGVNLFRFCSDQCTFRSCESAMVVGAFAASPIPVLLTEYGCSSFTWHINHTARVGVNAFQETRLLYSPAMTGVFSGGCAYTYGVRGGEEFAFFEGGGRSARGEPGAVKSCGWPDDLCRVDAYEQRLAEVEQRETQRKKQRAQEEEDGDGADDGAIMEHDAVTVACPVVLGVDLTLPDTRQGAEGYEPVPCQAGVGRMASEEDREADSEQDRLERQQEAAREESHRVHHSRRRWRCGSAGRRTARDAGRGAWSRRAARARRRCACTRGWSRCARGGCADSEERHARDGRAQEERGSGRGRERGTATRRSRRPTPPTLSCRCCLP